MRGALDELKRAALAVREARLRELAPEERVTGPPDHVQRDPDRLEARAHPGGTRGRAIPVDHRSERARTRPLRDITIELLVAERAGAARPPKRTPQQREPPRSDDRLGQ